MPWETTENYHRFRVRDPGRFLDDSFRTITFKGIEGIKAVVGKLKEGTGSMVLQSLLFDKDKWDLDRAKKWVAEHRADLVEQGLVVELAVPGVKKSGHKSPPAGYPEDRDKYADPTNYKYPLDTEEHVRAAISYFAKDENRAEYTPDEQKFMWRRIFAAARRYGIEISNELRQKVGLSDSYSVVFTEDPAGFADLEEARYRKQLLRYGRWVHPNRPGEWLEITRDFVGRLVQNFREKVLDKVPVPWRHTDNPRDNTGYVEELVQTDDGLDMIVKITDPAAVEKINRGEVPGVSARIDTNYLHKETGQYVGPVLVHAALVDNPYIKKMRDFEPVLAFSDDGGGGGWPLFWESGDSGRREGVKVTKEELAAKLKELGVDLADLESKAGKVVSLEGTVSRIKEVLKGAKVELADNADLAEVIKGLLGQNTQLQERVGNLETRILDMDAEKAVEVLLRDGKIVPAEKDSFVKLYKKDKSLFDELTGKLTKKVDFTEHGADTSGDNVPGSVTLSEAQVKSEIERYEKIITGDKK